MDFRTAWTLEDYVNSLLRNGKRLGHPDFEVLVRLYGQDKIDGMIKKLLPPQPRMREPGEDEDE